MATPNYGYTIPVSTDIVNLLTQCYPNFTAIDTDLKAISDAAVTVAVETKVGTVHNLVRSDTDRNVIRFVATSNYAAGDTFTVDGNAVTATTPAGTSIPAGGFVINSSVFAILDGAKLTVFVGGGSNDASDINYDNSGSGLTAADVQDAIDENAANIATNAAAIAGIVPGSKISILYTNFDDSQPMASGDTVTLSSDQYDLLIWVLRCDSNDPYYISEIIVKGQSLRPSFSGAIGGTQNIVTMRKINRTSDTVYTLEEGLYQMSGSARVTNNGLVIPSKIYGIKL